MSTFLQICQDVHRILRVGDNRPGSAPTTVVGQTDELGDIVYFTNLAWQMLQDHHPEWDWMRQRGRFVAGPDRVITQANIQIQTIAPDPLYPTLLIMDRWQEPRPFIAGSRARYMQCRDSNYGGVGTPSPTQIPVWFVPYQEWAGLWDRMPRPSGQRPIRWTMRPDFSLEFDPAPGNTPGGGVWIYDTDFRVTNQTLSVDADVPELPPQFHQIIVWWSVDLFCRSRSNMGPLSIEAKREVNRQLSRLAADQLPEFVQWSPYA